MDERIRDALRRNALLSEVLAEGWLPSADAALRARLSAELGRTRRRRRLVLAAAGVAAAVAVVLSLPGRVPPVAPPAVARPLLEVVRTAAPEFEVVATPRTSAFEIVRTPAPALDVARDEELLAAPGAVAIVGHPGGPRRLVVAP